MYKAFLNGNCIEFEGNLIETDSQFLYITTTVLQEHNFDITEQDIADLMEDTINELAQADYIAKLEMAIREKDKQIDMITSVLTNHNLKIKKIEDKQNGISWYCLLSL